MAEKTTKIDDPFDAEVRKQLRKPAPTAVAPIDEFDASVMEGLSALKKNSAVTNEAPPPPGWSAWQNFLDAMLLGHALPSMALMGEMGQPHDEKRLSTRVRELEEQKANWAQNNPLPATATELGGSMIPGLLAAGAMQNYVANPLLARAATLAPRVAAALPRWLPRTAGEATSGAIQGLGVGATDAMRRGEEDPIAAAKRSIEMGALANPLMRSTMRGLGLASHITPETGRYAQALANAGVPVRSAELPGASPGLKLLDRLFSRSGDARLREAAYGRATELAGARSKSIDQKWLDENMGFKDAQGNMQPGRIGKGLQAITDKYGFAATPAFVNNVLTPIAQKASALGVDVEKEFAPTLLAIAKDIGNAGVGNTIEGKLYQQWIQKGGTLDSALRSSNPNVRRLAGELKGALETNWKSGLPQDVATQWEDLRKQYRVGTVLQDWFKRSPKDIAAGELDPSKLYAAVTRNYGSAQKAGALGDLAVGLQMLPKAGEHGGHIKYPYLTRMGVTPLGLGAIGLLGIEASPYLREPIHGAIHSIWQDPVGAGIPLSVLAAGALMGGKLGASVMNSPAAAQRYAQAAMRGTQVSRVGGGNPLLPFISQMAPYWGEEPRTRMTVNPEEGMK